ncbi:MAG: hypothetical protein ACYDDF_09530 [Thermoplasmatota archaeon]
MEGRGILALAVVVAALVALVPIFNSLNSVKIGNVTPPKIDLKKPPPITPPPVSPPPVAPPCQVRFDKVVNQNFTAPSSSLSTTPFIFSVTTGARLIGIGVLWESYLGPGSVTLTAPNGTKAWDSSTPSSLVPTAYSHQDNGSIRDPPSGDWKVAIANNGFSGAFYVVSYVAGCYPTPGTPTLPANGTSPGSSLPTLSAVRSLSATPASSPAGSPDALGTMLPVQGGSLPSGGADARP